MYRVPSCHMMLKKHLTGSSGSIYELYCEDFSSVTRLLNWYKFCMPTPQLWLVQMDLIPLSPSLFILSL